LARREGRRPPIQPAGAYWLAPSLFLPPDVTVLPQVKSIADKSALIVNACFILAVISVGIAAMVGDSVETRYGIKRLSRGWSSGSCSPSSGSPDRRTDHDRQRPDRTPTVVVVVACH
jgi:hypothetical protein